MKVVGKWFMVIALLAVVLPGSIFIQNQSASAAPNTLPIISRSVPAFASSGTPSNANDNNYGTTWQSSAPGWISYNLSNVPASQRRQVVVAWYNDTYDYDRTVKNGVQYNSLKSYTIEGNAAASGSSSPTSGWVTLASVTNNTYHSRQHVVNLSGYNWVRLNIKEADSASGNNVSINFDVHNASQGVQDDWIFYGDSITAGSMVVSGSSNTFAQMVNAGNPKFFPVAEGGGIGGLLSTDGVSNISRWLGIFPGKYVGIAYGTNDAWSSTNSDTFYTNMENIVKAVINAGKTPVIAKIPWARLSVVQNNTPALNAKIEALYTKYPQIVRGPDLWTYFQTNQNYISSDGVHPTAAGYDALRQQWANAALTNVYGL